MAIHRIKPLDELYAEIADFDLVIAPDVSFANAINRRIGRPHLGPFAITPRRLAARGPDQSEARTAFQEVIRHTDLGWKEASVAIEELLQCWEHAGSADAILTYDAFDTDAIRTVLENVENLDITSRALAEQQVDLGTYPQVAVIEEGLLTPLQQSFLPDTYERIDLFLDDEFELPEFRIFDSPGAVVDAVVNAIPPAKADEIGIVLEAGSDYSMLLESALETAGIPYHGAPAFTDDGDIRTFLACLRLVFAGSDTRVESVRPYLSHLGIDVELVHDKKRLSDLDHQSFEWIKHFCDVCRDDTLEGALSTYEAQCGRSLDQLRDELTDLQILTAPITESVLDRLAFYFDTYDVPIDRDHEGVILADATAAAYVDRPLVFCLGMDEGWTHTSPRRPWIDSDQEFTRHVRKFELLLQSGTSQEFFVVNTVGGRAVSPTVYLDELLDVAFEQFSDLPSSTYPRAHWEQSPEGALRGTPTSTAVSPTETISQSRLNTLVASPRNYLFGQLVDSPEQPRLEEGTLFHDFAEFYLSHPDRILDASGEPDLEHLLTCAEVMLDTLRPFHSSADRTTCRTRYVAGLQTIVQYIRTHVRDHTDVDTELTRPDWADNLFANHFDLAIDASITELWFDDEDLGLRGMIDILAAEDHLVDLKSGSKTSPSSITKASALDPPTEAPNFQALLYLTYLRKARPGQELQFSFVHFLETVDDVVTGSTSIDDCITEICYLPITYAAYLRTEAVFDGLCNDASNACNKTFSKIDFETWIAILDATDVPKTRDEDELINSPFHETLLAQLETAVGTYKYVTKGCTQACRYLVSLRTHNYFEDDVDRFEVFVDEQLAALDRYRRGAERFPVGGLGGEPDWRRIDHRDMLLEGELTVDDRRSG